MIYTIKEGDYVIHTGLEGYNYINQVLTDMYEQSNYMQILTSINWKENKKYFKNE